MSENTHHEQIVETLKKIVEDAKVAMLVTQQADGKLVSRPMQLQEIEFDGDIWFLTRTDTDKYSEIKANPSVNVAFVDKSYASISGQAEFVDDLDRKKEFWNGVYDKMFDVSYDDPSVTLIKVNAESAEYWDTGATVKSVYNFVKKVVGKEEPVEPAKDTNQSVDL